MPELGSSTPVSPEFVRIVQKALSKDPDHRFGLSLSLARARALSLKIVGGVEVTVRKELTSV